jgi:hypothetical protein
MNTKLLYFGPQWAGSTSLQRLRAFEQLDGLTAIGVDSGAGIGGRHNLWRRVRWKLRLPSDTCGENQRLLGAARDLRPDIVLVDNSKVIGRSTLTRLRASGVTRLVYYSPDDIGARHNLSLPLKWSLPHWDIVCTTKTFNVPELRAMGARRPLLVGKAFDPVLHRPLDPGTVGTDFERFDAVFIGAYERERCASINALAESGVSVVVYGAGLGGWTASMLHPSIQLRPSVFDEDYVSAWHTGKVALCFLRKINRDRITQRTMEIAAIGRPMVAERTGEHDQHFVDGEEYLGFASDAELVGQVHNLLNDDARRKHMGDAGRRRCLASGYSTRDRARQMITAFLAP